MMHRGKRDKLNTMNDINLKTIELGLIIYQFISYFSFLPSIFHTFIYLFCFCFALFLCAFLSVE